MRSEKGSALVTVVLVVFVLTMVGIAALFYMTTEDRISGTDRLQKAAFYAAEVGMRFGERSVLDQAADNGGFANAILQTPSPNAFTVPDGGWDGIPLTDPTLGGAEVLDIPVPSGLEGYTVSYSLYLRNNLEDLSRNAQVDTDSMINLLSVATITTNSGQVVRKVLEEQISTGGLGGKDPHQKGGNQGGTGA